MKIKPEKKRKEFLKMAIEADLREKAKREYREKQDAYNNSKQGLLEKTIRRAVQKNYEAEKEAYNQMFEAIKVLREEVFQIISDYIEEEKESSEYVSILTISKILKLTELPIEKIKTVCKMSEYLNSLSAGQFNDYEKLFNSLIDKVDLKFALYAPKRSLARKNIKFNRLPTTLRYAVFLRIEEYGLFENEEYLRCYSKCFQEWLGDRAILDESFN